MGTIRTVFTRHSRKRNPRRAGAKMGSPQSRSTPALGISRLSPKERLDLIGGACGTASPLKEVFLTPAQERELDHRIATFEDAKTPNPRGEPRPASVSGGSDECGGVLLTEAASGNLAEPVSWHDARAPQGSTFRGALRGSRGAAGRRSADRRQSDAVPGRTTSYSSGLASALFPRLGIPRGGGRTVASSRSFT